MLDDNTEPTTDTQIDVSVASDPLAGALSKWYTVVRHFDARSCVKDRTTRRQRRKWRGFHKPPSTQSEHLGIRRNERLFVAV